jgi:hypothetical protein
VAGTTGSGISLSSNRSGLGCDLNSGTDETLPEDDFSLPDLDIDAGLPIDIGGGGFGDGGFGGGGEVVPNPDDGLDASTFSPHNKKEPNQPPVTGNGLDPALGVCGSGGAKSLTWYRNGVKIISGDYTAGGENVVITYQNPNEPIPAFLSFAQGILAIGTGDAGNIYTSVVECNDGRVSGRTTFVEEGLIQYNWRARVYRIENPFDPIGQPAGWGVSPYISYKYPPYAVAREDGGFDLVVYEQFTENPINLGGTAYLRKLEIYRDGIDTLPG